MYDVSLATFSFIMGVFLTCFAWLWLAKEYFDEVEKSAWELQEKKSARKLAGHKGSFTRLKRNYEVAKRILRKGRE